MSSTVFYDSTAEIATISATFKNSAGVNTDPTAVQCIITDPSNASSTHYYLSPSPADITRTGAGVYQLTVPCSPNAAGADGLWGYAFVGTGTVNDVQPGTWRVLPLAISQKWYVGLEEMRNRLSITDTSQDFELQTSIAATAGWINSYCGRHFNRVTEARTFVPYDIYSIRTDDMVPNTTISLNVDFDGDGIFEQSWTEGTDYQRFLGENVFNTGSTGVTRPYERIRVISSGRTFPFTWPFSPINRVQVITTWGWSYVPWEVSEANRILAAELFKMKDSPLGSSGNADIGVVAIGSDPWLVELLRPYVRARRKVGV